MRLASFLALLILAVLGPPTLALAALPSKADGPMLVVHAPWRDGTALVDRAGGAVFAPGSAPMGIFAYAEDPEAFAHRLRLAGAWAVFDGSMLAALCGIGSEADQGRNVR